MLNNCVCLNSTIHFTNASERIRTRTSVITFSVRIRTLKFRIRTGETSSTTFTVFFKHIILIQHISSRHEDMTDYRGGVCNEISLLVSGKWRQMT